MMTQPGSSNAQGDPQSDPQTVYRHRLPVRLWHWWNAVAIIGLFMSGLMIFNAHPRLYWGQYGANPDAAWMEIGAPNGQGQVRVGSLVLVTDGAFGRSLDGEGVSKNRAFPSWITLPGRYDLAGSRHFHLFFAWMLAPALLFFMLWSFFSRHASRDLTPRLKELGPRHLLHEMWDHARLKFPTGAAAARFNSLQKISYFVVIFLFIPVMIFSGMTLSPGANAFWPWLVELFGGRQSARSIHFIICWALFGFVIVHLIMVVLAGPINEIRSMITGWFRLPQPKTATQVPPEAAPSPMQEGDAA